MAIPIKCLKKTSKIHGWGNLGNKGVVIPNEVFENDSNECISNTKKSVNVTFASDDDNQLEAHNKALINQ